MKRPIAPNPGEDFHTLACLKRRLGPQANRWVRLTNQHRAARKLWLRSTNQRRRQMWLRLAAKHRAAADRLLDSTF
jgi:hypothetical protein